MTGSNIGALGALQTLPATARNDADDARTVA
jgi:hypothetical protein